MSEEERKKVSELHEKIKKVGKDFDEDAWFMCGVFAFCKEANNYGGSIKILDEMIKLLDRYPHRKDFITKASALVGL